MAAPESQHPGFRTRPPPQGLSPRLVTLFDYWNGKRRGRAMPSRADIEPAEIKVLLPYMMLFDVEGPPLDFRARLIGTAITAIARADHTGLRLTDLPGKGPGSVAFESMAQVVRSGVPLVVDTPYVGGREEILLRSNVVLPLGTDGHTVDKILSGWDYDID